MLVVSCYANHAHHRPRERERKDCAHATVFPNLAMKTNAVKKSKEAWIDRVQSVYIRGGGQLKRERRALGVSINKDDLPDEQPQQ
ncbi:hypothetical protein VTJ04DRAFT_6372 [Mycothermus thermophilus]|uniref:uncharacterized protein n=1 Tax=Humicola insolens TaxID=85995 RepID=UPI0037435CC9